MALMEINAIQKNEDATIIVVITNHNVPFDNPEELLKEFKGKIMLILGEEVHIDTLDYQLDHPSF